MEDEKISLRQKMVAVLTRSGEQLTYRQLTDAIWRDYPDFHTHMLALNEGVERDARIKLRIRMGMEVRDHSNVLAATKVDGLVAVGLAASEDDAVVEVEEEDEGAEQQFPSIYWYTFPAYRREGAAVFPIKIGKGANPEARIMQQVTAMPEAPTVLGRFAHKEADSLEKAIQYVLKVRGKRKADSPGAEWFLTTSEEIQSLIETITGSEP
jgi:hypothetical protein